MKRLTFYMAELGTERKDLTLRCGQYEKDGSYIPA